MKRILLFFFALLMGISGAWAYTTVRVTSAQDSKGNALVSGAFYRILLPSRDGNVALKQNGDYVQAHNGYGILGFMWKIEEDANGKALISNPAGGYWKFTDYIEGNSKLKTDGTSTNCTAFQMAWASSTAKTLNLFDPAGGTYSYGGVTCGAVLSNHGGVGNNMGIYNNILDGGSIFKFERFYRTIFTVENTDVNGVGVENYPTTVTVDGNTVSEYYTNSDNPITSFSTVYGAKYYIDGVEKTAAEVIAAINANTGTLTVTVKPRPFIKSTNENPVYYALMISGNANSWWENTNGTVVNCGSYRPLPAVTGRSNWIWELKQNGTNGYQIYNVSAEKYLGGRTATGDAFTLGDAASANSFKCSYNDNTTIKFKDDTNNLWIDRATVNNIGQPYAHTSGQKITFLRMYKVTFSEPISVNDVSDLTTIYVKGDGSDEFTLQSNKLYSINSADPIGCADAATAIAACASNLTVTVSDNTTKDVTYTLQWSDGTEIRSVDNVTTDLLTPAADYVPSAFVSDFTTLSYSPEEITNETEEVIVTATWNGPFLISNNYSSAIWQVVQMHTNNSYKTEKWSWSYKSEESNKVKPEQVLAYDAVTTNRLFCFVGNPYDGFKIYNAAAGSDYTLTRADESDELSMAQGDHIFNIYKSGSNPDATKYFTLKPNGASNYVNFNYNNKQINGWWDSDQGSTCWVVAPGQYYLDFIDGLDLSAPVGTVGTRTYFQNVDNVATLKTNLLTYRGVVANNMYSKELGSMNALLDPINATEIIQLSNGYYRIVNAFTSWTGNAPAIYASSANQLRWAKSENNITNFGNVLKLENAGEDNKYYLYSPNAEKYLTNLGGELGDTPTSITMTKYEGTAQYALYMADAYNNGHHYLHTLGHNSGNGSDGNLTAWEPGAEGASAWYIIKADQVELPLATVGVASYSTLYVNFPVSIPDGNNNTAIYTLEENSDSYTCVKQTSVPAKTGMILRDINKASSVTLEIPSSYSNVTSELTGSLLATTAGDNCYIFGNGDEGLGFYPYANGSTLAANKAFLTVTSSARSFILNFDDVETGINGAITLPQSSVIYDLQGRRANKLQRGLYIMNGKKVLF